MTLRWRNYLGAGVAGLFLIGAALVGYEHLVALPPLVIVHDQDTGLQRAWESTDVRFAIRNRSRRPVVVERIDKY